PVTRANNHRSRYPDKPYHRHNRYSLLRRIACRAAHLGRDPQLLQLLRRQRRPDRRVHEIAAPQPIMLVVGAEDELLLVNEDHAALDDKHYRLRCSDFMYPAVR